MYNGCPKYPNILVIKYQLIFFVINFVDKWCDNRRYFSGYIERKKFVAIIENKFWDVQCNVMKPMKSRIIILCLVLTYSNRMNILLQ